MTSELSYEEAVAQATTDQGLDPVIAALRAEFPNVEAEQTGGFVMVATVRCADGGWVGITESDADEFLVVGYLYGEGEDEGNVIADGVSDLWHVADFVRGFVRSHGGPTETSGRCIVCETTVRRSGRDVGESGTHGWIHDFCAEHVSPCFDRDLGEGATNRYGICALCGGPLDKRSETFIRGYSAQASWLSGRSSSEVAAALASREATAERGDYNDGATAATWDHLAGTASGTTYCPHHPDAVQVHCTNPRHDHFGQRDNIANGVSAPAEGVDTDQLHCNDCGLPSHYDSGDENYHHDDPQAPACFLIRN